MPGKLLRENTHTEMLTELLLLGGPVLIFPPAPLFGRYSQSTCFGPAPHPSTGSPALISASCSFPDVCEEDVLLLSGNIILFLFF